MLFSSAVTAFLGLSIVSASPISRRTAATVLSDITTITSDIASLQSDVTAFTGSLLQGLSLAASEETLNSKIESTTTDINDSTAFDTADSTSVTDAVNTIAPKIVTVLTDLGNKASVAASAGFTSIVLSAVQGLKTNTDALFAALEAKVDSGDVAAITSDQATVDAAFTTAIAAF